MAQNAVAVREPWTRRAGVPPPRGPRRDVWVSELAAVAAYRDRYVIDSTATFGSPTSDAQRADTRRAGKALRRALSGRYSCTYPQPLNAASPVDAEEKDCVRLR